MRHGRRSGDHQADRAADRRRSGRRARRRVGRVAARLGATRARRWSPQGSGVAAVPAAARGDGDAPRDRPRRGRDDGEPLLRQRAGNPARPAGPGGRRPAVPAGAGGGRQPRRAGHARPRRRTRRRCARSTASRRRPGTRATPRTTAVATTASSAAAGPSRCSTTRRPTCRSRTRWPGASRVGERYFCSCLAQTYPNFRYLLDGHVERRDPDGHLDVLGARRQRHDLRPLRPASGSAWKTYYDRPAGTARHPRGPAARARRELRQGRAALPRRRGGGAAAAVQLRQPRLRVGLGGEPAGRAVRGPLPGRA